MRTALVLALALFAAIAAAGPSNYTTCESCTGAGLNYFWCATTQTCQTSSSCWHGTSNPANCIKETCHSCVDDDWDYWCYSNGVGYCSGTWHSGQSCFDDYNMEYCNCDAKTSCDDCVDTYGCSWCSDGGSAPYCRGTWSGASPTCYVEDHNSCAKK